MPSRTFTGTQRLSWCRYLSIHVRRTFQLAFLLGCRFLHNQALSRLKSVDAINALLMARCSHATPKDSCSLSISNADSTLRIFKEQQPSLKGRPEHFDKRSGLLFMKNTEECHARSGLVVEDDGIEPTTPCLQSRCSPS